MVQWLGFHASTAGGMGSIPGWGTKILHAVGHGQKTNIDAKKKMHGKQKILKNENIKRTLLQEYRGLWKKMSFLLM